MGKREQNKAEEIAHLTSQLKQSMGKLKRAYNQDKEEEDRKTENPEAILDELEG